VRPRDNPSVDCLRTEDRGHTDDSQTLRQKLDRQFSSISPGSLLVLRLWDKLWQRLVQGLGRRTHGMLLMMARLMGEGAEEEGAEGEGGGEEGRGGMCKKESRSKDKE
jgi:hypothetical protein